MNYDQKAVKFLANFYVNGGKHWAHGPMRRKPLVPTRPTATVLVFGPRPGAAWAEMWSPAVQEVPGYLQEPPPVCTGSLKELWLESRPPVVTDPHIPGPTTYKVPDASVRESSPHPNFSIGRKHPAREGGGPRAWQTVWFQSKSSFMQKADIIQEQKLPSPTGHSPLGGSPFPAFSFGVPHPAANTVGAGHRAQTLLQAPLQAPVGGKHPNFNTYDILPGCRLQTPGSAAFRSRSPAFASWVSSSCNPGPAAYHVEDCYNSRFPSVPGVVIQGVRRPKRHDTGPFCAL